MRNEDYEVKGACIGVGIVFILWAGFWGSIIWFLVWLTLKILHHFGI